jgi:catechol 2,3-dioxygenase-like lactoylglutathione lyase family enzyme
MSVRPAARGMTPDTKFPGVEEGEDMKRMLVAVISVVCLLASAPSTSAQLLAAKEGPIVYGHHHLNASNIDAQKKFFVDTLGGKAIKIGTNNTEVVEFPNVFIFFRQQAPTAGTRGSTVNHIGFSVPNLAQTIVKMKANGYRMITREEVVAGREVKNDIAAPTAPGGSSIAFVMGPDDTKVELVEIKTQTMPVMLHHVHFFNPQNADVQAWYVKVFGAKPGTGGGAFPTATLPGVALNFSPSAEPVVGTQGRALDHIGFEIKNLAEFCKKLEAQGVKLERPYTKVDSLGIAIAFIRDPWGTYIELTEGLDKVA